MSDHADDDTKKEALSTHFLDSDDDDEKQMREMDEEENDDDAFLASTILTATATRPIALSEMQMDKLNREEEVGEAGAKLKILKDRKRILEKAKERRRNKGRQQQGEKDCDKGEDEKIKEGFGRDRKKVKKKIDEAGLSSDDDLSSHLRGYPTTTKTG